MSSSRPSAPRGLVLLSRVCWIAILVNWLLVGMVLWMFESECLVKIVYRWGLIDMYDGSSEFHLGNLH